MRLVPLVLSTAGASCQGSEVVVPETDLPLCAERFEPAEWREEIGTLASEGYVLFAADSDACPGEDGRAYCPVFSSWRAVTVPFGIRASGVAPQDVRILVSWTLGDEVVGEIETTGDLVCDAAGEPEWIPMTLSFGAQHGEPEDFACLPGRIHLAVAPASGDPRSCTEETCLVADADVAYKLSAE